MITISISKETKVEINSTGIEQLQSLLDEPYSRNVRRRLIVSKDTSAYMSMIYTALGIDYSSMLKIVPNDDSPFGVITVEYTDMIRGTCNISNDYTVIQNNTYGDTTKLNETITMQSPTYLIMSASTWNFLNHVSTFATDADSYPINGVAYYHSYHKVPVALCELLDFGRIDLV